MKNRIEELVKSIIKFEVEHSDLKFTDKENYYMSLEEKKDRLKSAESVSKANKSKEYPEYNNLKRDLNEAVAEWLNKNMDEIENQKLVAEHINGLLKTERQSFLEEIKKYILKEPPLYKTKDNNSKSASLSGLFTSNNIFESFLILGRWLRDKLNKCKDIEINPKWNMWHQELLKMCPNVYNINFNSSGSNFGGSKPSDDLKNVITYNYSKELDTPDANFFNSEDLSLKPFDTDKLLTDHDDIKIDFSSVENNNFNNSYEKDDCFSNKNSDICVDFTKDKQNFKFLGDYSSLKINADTNLSSKSENTLEVQIHNECKDEDYFYVDDIRVFTADEENLEKEVDQKQQIETDVKSEEEQQEMGCKLTF